MSAPGAPVLTSRTHPLVQRMRRQARGRSADDPTVVLDGVHLVAMAADLGLALEAVLVDQAGASDEVTRLVAHLERSGTRVTPATAAVLDAASPVQSPSPIVALARLGPTPLASAVPAGAAPAMVVLVDAVQDPGNVGAIVRTADAAGASAVVCVGACADPFGWKALRGSMGSALRLPVCIAPSLDDTLEFLTRAHVEVYGLDARATLGVDDAPWPDRVALAVGREGAGLDDAICAGATTLIRIPMRDGVESLNVAVATGIALYAARRVRRATPDARAGAVR